MDCKPLFLLLLLTVFTWSINATWSYGQSARVRSVEVSATIQENPPQFNFSWPEDISTTGYQVYRKDLEATDWGTAIASLPGDATSFSDIDIETGIGYEYAFFKKGFDLVKDTFCIESGLELRFKISDMYGIGLCCSFGFGYYQVEACGEVKAYGDNFGSDEITIFDLCDDGNTCEEVIITITPDMFPNSTSWTLKNFANNEVLAFSGSVGDFITERPKYGFIYSGIRLPALEDRGEILLVVDDAYLFPLENEIATLQMDFIRDGWEVSMLSVSASETVPDVRALIQQQYAASANLKAVYLLGDIPVPYSGNIYPDTHNENHQGAWSADSYYGEMDGNWTDEVADITTAFFERNHNVPGDGKFDQDSIPSLLELQVGRVDLSNLSDFSLDDIELTRRYLNKAHAFKLAQIQVNRRALVDDNFEQAFAAPAASAWRNFAPMFGADQVEELDYFSTMHTESYLWSYGCGSGTHISASGIGATTDFAADSLLSVFTMLFGSQFGDWDNSNNFLRAPLAQGLTLTNVWAGNPPWTFHHMAMGYPIGYSTIRTLNGTNGVYLNGPQLVHANLMGDPSLRMHPVKPVDNLFVENDIIEIDLEWEAPIDETNVEGYYVYKKNFIENRWERISPDVVTETQFTDQSPDIGANHYMVKTVKLEISGSGSYLNLALGVIDSADFVTDILHLKKEKAVFSISPNPASDYLFIHLEEPNSEAIYFTLMNSKGEVVREYALHPYNITNVKVNLKGIPMGIYFLNGIGKTFQQVEKVVVLGKNE